MSKFLFDTKFASVTHFKREREGQRQTDKERERERVRAGEETSEEGREECFTL